MDVIPLDGLWLASLLVATGMGWIAGRRLGALEASQAPLRSRHWFDREIGTHEDAGAFMTGSNQYGAKALERSGQGETANCCDVDLSGAVGSISTFDEMPPVEAVRAQANAIRRAADVWNTPGITEQVRRIDQMMCDDPIDVLKDYRSAIQSLGRLKATSERDPSVSSNTLDRSTKSTALSLLP